MTFLFLVFWLGVVRITHQVEVKTRIILLNRKGINFEGNESNSQNTGRYLSPNETLLHKLPERKLYEYKHLFSGFAAPLTDREVESLKSHAYVDSIHDETVYSLRTRSSGEFLGLNKTRRGLWKRTNGSDVIIGMLDSGIWPEDESFSDQKYGPIPSKWKGICQEGQEWNSSNCNKKVIGARWFNKGYAQLTKTDQKFTPPECMEYLSARDAIGHGSHTASIASGSPVDSVNIQGFEVGSIQGVAFGARLAIYKVCWCNKNGPIWPNAICSSVDILAAMEAAVADGVDIISASLGGGPVKAGKGPSDLVAYAAYRANLKIIPTVFAAGNHGSPEGWYTVENSAPWQFTVASSSMDRVFQNTIRLGDGREMKGTALVNNGTKPLGRFYPLVLAEKASLNPNDTSGARLCNYNSLNSTKVRNAIVLCERGPPLGIVDKGQSVKDAGGLGIILYNPSFYGEDAPPLAHLLPASLVGFFTGAELRNYVISTKNPKAYITKSVEVYGSHVVESPIMRAESSVGPSESCFSIIKPDLTAPGDLVLGAWSQNPKSDGISRTSWLPTGDPVKYSFEYGGTSIAAPHVAGVLALLKSLNPHWPPSFLYSALTTTALRFTNHGKPILAPNYTNNHNYDRGTQRIEASPFHFGGGHLNPNRAIDPGLVFALQEEYPYSCYLCSQDGGFGREDAFEKERGGCPGGERRALDLNLPSISFFNVSGESESAFRSVTNLGSDVATYFLSSKAPAGSRMVVHPQILKFTNSKKVLSFQVRIYPTEKSSTVKSALKTFRPLEGSEGLEGNKQVFFWSFGSITWSDWFGHKVRINVALNVP